MENEEDCRKDVVSDEAIEMRTSWKNWICNVDIEMLPTKITYLLWGFLIGSYHIYLIPFFKSIGLSVSQAGLITGMISVSYSFAGPFWGMITDYTGRRKSILVILCLVSAATIISIPWVAASLRPHIRNISHAYINNFNNRTIASKNNTIEFLEIEKSRVSSLFQVFFLLITLGSIFFGTLPGYIDAISSHVVKTSTKKATYGGQRIFGSIGACISVYISGLAVDYYQADGMSNYSIVFIIYVPFALLMIPMGCILIHQATIREKNNTNILSNNDDTVHDIDSDKSILLLLAETFRQLDIIFFFFTTFISGLAFSLFIYFTSLLLEEETELSKSKIGLVFSIATGASVIMFPFTAELIKLLQGPIPAISLGISSYFLRFLIMSYITSYWVVAATQLLNCVGFALLWTAMMEHIHVISPKKIKVTMLLILQSIHFGVAPFTTNIVGGKIFDMFGGKILFRSASVLCGIWGSISYIKYYVSKYLKDKRQNISEKVAKDSLIEM